MSHKKLVEYCEAISFDIHWTDSQGRYHKIEQPKLEGFAFKIKIVDIASAETKEQ